VGTPKVAPLQALQQTKILTTVHWTNSQELSINKMANLTAQTMATLNKHKTQMNASLQQLVANTSQLHQQQQTIMNQMTMMSFGGASGTAVKAQQSAHTTPEIYQYPA
jgi:hypothetical protein